MERSEFRSIVLSALGRVAPDVDLRQVRDDVALREQFELDSMDFLTFVEVVHERTGVNIKERDYPRLSTVDGCVTFLADRATRAAR